MPIDSEFSIAIKKVWPDIIVFFFNPKQTLCFLKQINFRKFRIRYNFTLSFPWNFVIVLLKNY